MLQLGSTVTSASLAWWRYKWRMTMNDAISISNFVAIHVFTSLTKSAPLVNERLNHRIKRSTTNLWRLLDSTVSCAKKPFNANQIGRFSIPSFALCYSRRLLQQRHAGALPSCTAADAADDNLKRRIDQPVDSAVWRRTLLCSYRVGNLCRYYS